MKLIILNKLLQEKGWQVVRNSQGHYFSKNHGTCFITPFCSPEEVPVGTHNAALRSAHKAITNKRSTISIRHTTSIKVILEKHASTIWGRIETPGLFAITHGHTIENIISTLQILLMDCVAHEEVSDQSVFSSAVFEPVYDTTAVWDLFKQLKANYIAEEAGIDIELINKFITGSTFPSVEQAERLETSIHELGRQLIQLSIC